MVVQAIALLDDLDKELNTYAMRVKEWYGWHFPEMAKIINDNLAYSRVILSMGMRSSASKADLAEILPEEIEIAVKSAAEISMGTEITMDDLENIKALGEQVVGFTEYRSQLSDYLSARMAAIAPNLTALVGDLVGARLIAHAGSLMNLAKSPASTIQILGAEKALFRALKTKHDTPKYGLIYHASLIGQATGKNKGKIARMLATKAALGLRVDALADWSAEGEGKGDLITEEEKSVLGMEGRMKIERRLAHLEGKPIRQKGVSIAPNGISVAPGKWEIKEARKYNPDADGLAGDEPAAVAKASKNEESSRQETNISPILHEEAEPSLNVLPSNPPDFSDDVSVGHNDEPRNTEAPLIAELPSSSIPPTNGTLTNGSTMDNGDVNVDVTMKDHSDTISTVSSDSPDSPNSPTPQETNWQSPILGNTIIAKKARKKERHERKLASSEQRSKERALRKAKLERRLNRKERRQKRADQIEVREERDEARFTSLAEQAGLSIARYKKKLARGEIRFTADGTPEVIHKRDLKKARKAAEAEDSKANGVSSSGNKRKREKDIENVVRSEKKSKKSKT